MILKITEKIGVDLLMLESGIVQEINNKTKTYRKFPFRKTKEELEALNQWRQAIVEAVNIVRKYAAQDEKDFIKTIFLAGLEAAKEENVNPEDAFAAFADMHFNRTPTQPVENGEQPDTEPELPREEV